MTAADLHTAQAATPDVSVPRVIRLVRVAVLLASGLAITFTAPMHGQLGFDLGMFAIAFSGIAIAHLLHAFVVRGRAGAGVALMLGLAAAAAAVLVPLVGSVASPGGAELGAVVALSILVAAWALVSGLLEFIGALTQPGTRQDAVLLGGVGILLALLVLVFREDPVAVIGFFGAYAVIAGVFLGISAFDTRRAGASAGAGAGASASAGPVLATDAPSARQ